MKNYKNLGIAAIIAIIFYATAFPAKSNHYLAAGLTGIAPVSAEEAQAGYLMGQDCFETRFIFYPEPPPVPPTPPQDPPHAWQPYEAVLAMYGQ